MTLTPTDELVAEAWLFSCPLLTGIRVGTVLPKEVSRWEGPTFITVRVSPLSPPPHPIFPSHAPRVVVSCWALPKQWADAADVSQSVRKETRRRFNGARVVTLPVSGYATADVKAVQYLAEPSRVDSDPNQLARYDIPLQFEWVESDWAFLS